MQRKFIDSVSKWDDGEDRGCSGTRQGGATCTGWQETFFFGPNRKQFFVEWSQPVKNLLKLKRWETGMKQYELAARLGCSSSYLSMVENGRLEPTREFKEKAAALFALEINQLFPERDNYKIFTGMSG